MKLPDQIQFQGSAESKGFNPITPASPTKALDAEAARLSQNWQEVAGQNLSQEKAAINFVNEQTRYNLQALSGFSNTLGKRLEEERDSRNEALTQEGLALAFNQGIKPEVQAEFDTEEAAHRASHDGIQTIADQALKNGASQEGVNMIRNLSGWKKYGYAMGLAQLAGMEYGTWVTGALREDDKTEIQIGDKRFTPASADTPEEKAAALEVVRRRYMAERGISGLNPALLNKYAFVQMREVEARYMASAREEYQKRIDEENTTTSLNNLYTNVATDPGIFETTVKDLMRTNKSGSEARKLAMDNLYKMERAGRLPAGTIQNIQNTTFSVTGKSWGESFQAEWIDAEQRSQAAQQERYQQNEAQITMQKKQELDSIMAEITATPQSDAQVKTIIQMWQQKWGTPEVPSELQNYLTNSTLQARSRTEQEAQLVKLEASEQLTTTELNSGKYDDVLKIKYRAKAQAIDKLYAEGGEVAKASKNQVKAVEDAVNTVGRIGDNDSVAHPSVHIAKGVAVSDLNRQAKALKMANPNMSWDSAYNQAAMSLSQEILAGKGRWQTNGQFGPNAAFSSFSTGLLAQQNVKAAQAKIASMKSTVVNGGIASLKENKNGLFTESELKALANPETKDFSKIGMITGWLNQGGKNVTIDQAIDLALSSAGLKREAPFKQDPYEQTALSANMIRLLTSPTPARISRVSAQGSLPPPTIRQGVEGGRDVIQAAISFGLPPAIAPLAGVVFGLESGWGKFQSGKNNVFGIKGKGTVTNTKEDYGNGKVGVRAEFRDYASPVQSVNDFVQLLKDPRYARVLKAATPIEALRELRAAGYATDRDYVKNATPLFTSLGINPNQPYAYQGLTSSPWSNPALMGNAAKQFITGNTGRGTGAHLDMRVFNPSTGDYDNPKGYENYLVVGGVPIAKKYSVTSGYGPRRAPVRGATTFHKGVDYGTPEGTAVTVRGGSYLRTWWDEGGGGVVSSYRLPDGKELRLLHGSKQNLQS